MHFKREIQTDLLILNLYKDQLRIMKLFKIQIKIYKYLA